MYGTAHPERFELASYPAYARPLFELVTGYALILSALWTSGGIQRLLILLAAAWIILTTHWRPSAGEPEGMQPFGLRHSWWIVVSAVAFGGVAVVISARAGTLHIPVNLGLHPTRVWGYVIWSFVQQFILQDYFFVRFRRLIPNSYGAVAATAILFSLAHLPNPVLTIATLFWGAAACLLFLRYRDLYSLGAAHAILGLCIAFTIPDAVHHQMRVGLGYLTYHPHHSPHLSQP
jgi:hypothetical protein